MRDRFRLLLFLCFAAMSTAAVAQDSERGMASYYGNEFQGRKTAYGDTYDKNKLTTAHKRHPYGTMIKVTRLDNKKSVVVKVTDKGPYVKGRVVDLSRKAAEKLGMISDGTVEVEIEVVKKVIKEDVPPSELAVNIEEPAAKTTTSTSSDEPAEYSFDADPSDNKEATAPKEVEVKKSTSVTKEDKPAAEKAVKVTSSKTTADKADLKEKSTTPPSRGKLVGKDYTQYGLYRIVLERPSQKGYGVQVASLTNYENVLRQVADLQAKSFDNILVSVEKGDKDASVYKVILGPFDTEGAAKNYAASAKKKYKVSGFVVNLEEIKY